MGDLIKTGTGNSRILSSEPDGTAPTSPAGNLLLWVVLTVAVMALICA